MGKTIKNALEWQNSQATKIPSTSSKDCPIKKAPTQSQIMENAFSCYSDAAWNSNSCAGGLGWICFKPDGTKLFQGSSAHQVIASVLVAEALSLKAAINAAIAHGAKDLVCFSDSKILISLITGNMSVISLQGILHDIGVLSRSPSSISFKFVSRNGNVVADGLAKSALFYVSNSPSEIVNYVAGGGCDGILLLTLSENLRALYQAIASAAAEPKPEESEKSSQHILEDFHSSRTIRRLVLDSPTFASILFKKALSGKCRSWAQGNCSRILYAFLETQDDQVREMAKEELQVLVDEGALKITGTKKPK
ncbi:hypothetical protein DY000_02046182 [Brassica cretica]|uniref:RNase H type-1 domain-containing protein n=1 Tax=Brassica cretica TaxID=69181 RepID=A0ABQ7EZ07_BRACR|nr:hypothetical protein DY000_02046182 [Brassica cretica]